MKVLDRHIVRAILLHTLMVAAVLLALTMMFTFLGEQDDIGVGTYEVGDAFVFTLLSVPQQLFEGLPIAALIGAILGLGGLARDGWAPYRQFTEAVHQTCLGHLLRRCRTLQRDYPRARFPARVARIRVRRAATEGMSLIVRP